MAAAEPAHYLGATSRRPPLHIADDAAYPLDCVSIPPQYKGFLANVLLPHGLILDRIEKLAEDIRTDMPGSTPHVLVVLKGGSEFATDLTRSLRKRHTYSGSTHLPFTVDYIRVKSYEGTESTGNGALDIAATLTSLLRDAVRAHRSDCMHVASPLCSPCLWH